MGGGTLQPPPGEGVGGTPHTHVINTESTRYSSLMKRCIVKPCSGVKRKKNGRSNCLPARLVAAVAWSLGFPSFNVGPSRPHCAASPSNRMCQKTVLTLRNLTQVFACRVRPPHPPESMLAVVWRPVQQNTAGARRAESDSTLNLGVGGRGRKLGLSFAGG